MGFFERLWRKLYATEYEMRDVRARLAAITPADAFRMLEREIRVVRPDAELRWDAPDSPGPGFESLPPIARGILASYFVRGESTGLELGARHLRPSDRFPGGYVVGRERTYDVEYVVMPDEAIIQDDGIEDAADSRDRSLAHSLLMRLHSFGDLDLKSILPS